MQLQRPAGPYWQPLSTVWSILLVYNPILASADDGHQTLSNQIPEMSGK